MNNGVTWLGKVGILVVSGAALKSYRFRCVDVIIRASENHLKPVAPLDVSVLSSVRGLCRLNSFPFSPLLPGDNPVCFVTIIGQLRLILRFPVDFFLATMGSLSPRKILHHYRIRFRWHNVIESSPSFSAAYVCSEPE